MSKERVNVYLPKVLVKKSKEVAKSKDDSFSDIVRDALEKYLEKYQNEEN